MKEGVVHDGELFEAAFIILTHLTSQSRHPIIWDSVKVFIIFDSNYYIIQPTIKFASIEYKRSKTPLFM